MINIEEKFFHGINLANYSEYVGDLSELKILEFILKSGKILNRNDLQKEKPENLKFLNIYHGQTNNEICLAFHPNNKKYKVINIEHEDAFYDFVMYHISIILKENIIFNNHYSISGIPREIRIKNSILLPEYIEAIGYYDKITDITETIDRLINNQCYKELKKLSYQVYYRDFFNAKDIERYVVNEYIKYQKIQQLLNKNCYDIPIIDPFTGKEYNTIDKSIINAKRIIKKLNQI